MSDRTGIGRRKMSHHLFPKPLHLIRIEAPESRSREPRRRQQSTLSPVPDGVLVNTERFRSLPHVQKLLSSHRLPEQPALAELLEGLGVELRVPVLHDPVLDPRLAVVQARRQVVEHAELLRRPLDVGRVGEALLRGPDPGERLPALVPPRVRARALECAIAERDARDKVVENAHRG